MDGSSVWYGERRLQDDKVRRHVFIPVSQFYYYFVLPSFPILLQLLNISQNLVCDPKLLNYAFKFVNKIFLLILRPVLTFVLFSFRPSTLKYNIRYRINVPLTSPGFTPLFTV